MDRDRNGVLLAIIENFMGSRIVQMAVERGFNRELIFHVVTQHFMETGRQFSTLDELCESILEKSKPIIENFMGSRIVQMAVERGFNRELIFHVVTQHFLETGRQFSTLDELRESIWEKAKPIIENFMGSRIVQMAVRVGINRELIFHVVTQHFMETGRQFSTLDELVPSILELEAKAIIENFMGSRIVQMAVRVGIDRELILHVVTQHIKETGRQFSTLHELIESIWEADQQTDTH